MDLEGVLLSEVSQMEKDKYHMISYDFTHMWNIKSKQTNKWTKQTKQKQMHGQREQNSGFFFYRYKYNTVHVVLI